MKNLTGEEKFKIQKTEYLPFGVIDFWRWAYGNLLDNTRRGALAEYLVQQALSLDTSDTQIDWGEYDILYKNIRIEVKCSAYIQAWNLNNDKYSKLIFSIRPAYIFDVQTHKYNDEKKNNNDVYIFAVYEEKDKQHIDICDLVKWGFYVVPTAEIVRCFNGQKTVSLERLKTATGVKRCGWNEIKQAVDKLINVLAN